MEVIPTERPERLTAANHGHLDLTHVKTEEMSLNLSHYPEDMDHKYTDLNRTTLWTEDKTLICSTKENTERRYAPWAGDEIFRLCDQQRLQDCRLNGTLGGKQHAMLVRGYYR